MNLHSTGIKDQKHKIICQIADIVWGEGPGGARSDPPETGVLLPALYSDTNYTSSDAR